MSDFNHEPVLLQECIELLRIRENGALSSPTHPEYGDPNQKAPFLSGGLFGF